MHSEGFSESSLFHTGHLLRRTQQLHVALWNREVSTEVSSVQFATLAVLNRRPGISQTDLCDELDLDRSTIADLVQRMSANGLIVRSQDQTDRRKKVLELSTQGMSLFASLHEGADRVETLLREGLSPEETLTLQQSLLKMLHTGHASGVLRSIATTTRQKHTGL